MSPDNRPDNATGVALDLATLTSSGLRRQAFPAPALRQTEPQVVVRQSVRNAIHRHGRSCTDVEICGVLVGDIYQDDAGSFVYVQACIRGEHAGSQLAQVTFTAETWGHVQSVMDRDFPDLRVLGWYHTHPGFGVFLSAMDLFIHRNFFNHPEQLALVFDPIGGDEGVFVWRKGEPTREAVLIEEDEPAEVPTTNVGKLPPLSAAGDDLVSRIVRVEKQQRRLMASLGVVALLAFVWLAPLTWIVIRDMYESGKSGETRIEAPISPRSSIDSGRGANHQSERDGRLKNSHDEHVPQIEIVPDQHLPQERSR